MKKALKSIISTALVLVVAVSIMMTFVVGITSDVSIAKQSDKELKPGSVVLFKRGDVWRGEGLLAKPGVTYSAYGTGPKPAFRRMISPRLTVRK